MTVIANEMKQSVDSNKIKVYPPTQIVSLEEIHIPMLVKENATTLSCNINYTILLSGMLSGA